MIIIPKYHPALNSYIDLVWMNKVNNNTICLLTWNMSDILRVYVFQKMYLKVHINPCTVNDVARKDRHGRDPLFLRGLSKGSLTVTSKIQSAVFLCDIIDGTWCILPSWFLLKYWKTRSWLSPWFSSKIINRQMQ